MKLPKFLLGLLIGGLLGLIFWYWQKSTSAEDGALELMDRLAATQARVTELQAKLRMAAPESETAPSRPVERPAQQHEVAAQARSHIDDLKAIKGIGPTYAGRLHEAGILTFADLASREAEDVAAISGARSVEDAQRWIEAARQHSRS